MKNALKGKWKLTKDNFVIMVLLGILLLVIALPVKQETDKNLLQSGQWDSDDVTMESWKENSTDTPEGRRGSDTEAEYAEYLEGELERLLATMDGVGEVKVMITLEDRGETLVEKDQVTRRAGTTEVDSAGGSRNTTDISTEESTVFSGQGSQEAPFIRQVKYPRVCGVAVSAQGGGDARTAQKITKAIQALFGIEPHKIIIVKMITR
ncbi:MAG: stage III sporulation protein AG [Lachnospiraceae bacterium]|nr:stage III sporulation protein AG [Lachnospiraceae bacterium]